ncbi:tRNA-dihydrouridine synthase [Actinokineospora sp. NBRC 105648]|uniref:tRNA-dihydrouridine synthase n=1 Tax=Actinokineospora sp. NBRC 105648 TaxID=3032206 RepID=UPI00255785B1|nr:tRNA-dihydrouridine synthase [Actinokineospora sp. NBRC 105648]
MGDHGTGWFPECRVPGRRVPVRRSRSRRSATTRRGQRVPRSLQLYSVDPKNVTDAVTITAAGGLPDHLDMNFGCPTSTP